MKLSEVLQHSEESERLRKVLINWHKDLQENRGERARLRREKSPLDVYISEDFRRGIVNILYQENFEFNESDLGRLALPLGLISHIKILDDSAHFAMLFAKSDKGSAYMKDVRFRKMLSIAEGDQEALYVMMLRMIKLMGCKAGLKGLLEGGCYWNDYSRRRWAEQYYSVKK
ncbi:type I-E CRISPR-associated protein Cse2/CasB [Maridesulfovibrio sp.]|uniref:type I-E CRISPR-associated protein Cse2/CasB n=1 Tax=Maridesulfovibrio sp. TaxID=2795000 RepID=UPI0029C9FAB9|nr:type I-E CRISPR-associated protein Cse2/CasB [Maridesulfovibrio sp.]